MMLSIIVAVAEDGAIGKGNDLLWRLPADLKRFKALTTGHSIIMGRRTWESLPNGALPNRRNIVLSRQKLELEGAEIYASLDEALKATSEEEEVFVIGGGQLYKEILALADKLYLTEVKASYPDADTHFPELNEAEWTLLSEEHIPRDERNALDSTFRVLERKA